MRVNLKNPILGLDGLPVLHNDGRPIIAGKEIAVYLYNLSSLKGAALTPEQKYRAYTLCMRIGCNPENLELTTEEACLIKDVCFEKMSAGAYGQIVDMIENNIQ